MAASTAVTSAGTTIAVTANAPATYDAAGFGALTFTVIGEVVDLGEFGRKYNLVTHNPLGDRRTVKRKGSFNDGTISMQLARDSSNAGQAILGAAVDDDASYSFKVVTQDGTVFYFSAQVMSHTAKVGGVDTIFGSTVDLEIDNDIIEV